MLQMEADDVCSASVAKTTNIINHNQNIINNTNNHHNKSVECQNFNVKTPTNNCENKKERLKTATVTTTTTTSELCSPTLLHITSAPSLQQQQQQQQEQPQQEEVNTLKELTSTTCDTHVQRSFSNASLTPTTKMVRKSIDSMASLRRRVSFPKYDNELVTGYLEPANPWQYSLAFEHISEVAELYERSCRKHNTNPLTTIQDHLKSFELNKDVRQPLLCLKAIKLAPNDCEALEEIFKRVQYKSIDLSACDLEESAASALFEMIEYYEATNELDISSNAKGMTHRGWVSCTYMISHSRALQVLNAQGNPLSRQSAENLGHALSTSNLHTIKLEHCGLKGAPLGALCLKLRHNRILKELWLAYNDLDCVDAETIADLLKVNYYLELVDISNNNIQDVGLKSIVRALLIQGQEIERKAKARREELEHGKCATFEVGDSLDNDEDDDNNFLIQQQQQQQKQEEEEKKNNENNVEVEAENQVKPEKSLNSEIVEENVTVQKGEAGEEEQEEEEDKPLLNCDDVKCIDMSNENSNVSQIVGQSMLDKLLSMNCDATENVQIDDANVNVNVNINGTILTPIKADINQEDKTTENRENDNNEQKIILENNFELIGEEKNANSMIIEQKDDIEDIEEQTKRLTIKQQQQQQQQQQLTEEFDDTHSTDSAFESASEGDISRHLSEDYARTLATVPVAVITTTTTTATTTTNEDDTLDLLTNAVLIDIQSDDAETISGSIEEKTICTPMEHTHTITHTHTTPTHAPPLTRSNDIDILPKNNKNINNNNNNNNNSNESPIASPASFNMRRTDGGCNFITQASRNYSQSTDSLCSDNSLDGSITSNELNFGTNTQLKELTKNDTLTRQQRPTGISPEIYNNNPSGLKALAIWNNNLSKEAGLYISDLFASTESLELLNIGKNCLSNEFVTRIKEQLISNRTLTTLGLQSAHLSEQGIETLISILTFGGNNTLQRIDIRDNKLTVESLLKIEEMLKSNTTLMQIDIDDEPKRLSVGTEEHQNYTRILQNIRSMCARNEQNLLQNANKMAKVQETGFPGRGGYYVSKRKISLTCYNGGIVDNSLASNQQANAVTAINKLDTKRKSGCRLRSPVPSPSAISPSSSPHRSRFQVFRVSEPSAATTTVKLVDGNPVVNMCTPSPLSPLTGVKSLGSSPRSRFQVCRIYEDTKLPLDQRALPPITPPIYPPPTPLSKTVPNEAAQLLNNSSITITTTTTTTMPAPTTTTTTKIVDFMPDTITIEPNMKANNNNNVTTAPTSTTPTATPTTTTIMLEKCVESEETDVSDTSSSSVSTSSTTSSTRSSVSPTLQAALNINTNYVDNFYEDNEATITENSANYIKTENNDNEQDNDNDNDNHKECDDNAEIMAKEQNERKTSWISNPATVDKLLNIFQNRAAFFQHNSNEQQQEAKDAAPTTTVQAFHPTDCALLSTFPVHKSMHWQVDNFPMSAATAHAKECASSPVPWCSNGAEIAKTLATTAAAATLVQSRSFLDNASRQFKDLGKQMFGNTFPLSGERKLEAAEVPQSTPPKELIEIKTEENTENGQD